jgi:hypothetical protein
VTLPVVFIPNPSDGSLMPIRLSQPIAAIAALLASMLFLWRTRSGPLDLWRCLAMGVAIVSNCLAGNTNLFDCLTRHQRDGEYVTHGRQLAKQSMQPIAGPAYDVTFPSTNTRSFQAALALAANTARRFASFSYVLSSCLSHSLSAVWLISFSLDLCRRT